MLRCEGDGRAGLLQLLDPVVFPGVFAASRTPSAGQWLSAAARSLPLARRCHAEAAPPRFASSLGVKKV